MKLLGYITQYMLNWLVLLDHALNTLLLGDAGETVSARTARARNAGSTPAYWFCAFLTWLTKIITFGKVTRDHCTYALDRQSSTNTREIWNWSKGKLNEQPEQKVDILEKSDQ